MEAAVRDTAGALTVQVVPQEASHSFLSLFHPLPLSSGGSTELYRKETQNQGGVGSHSPALPRCLPLAAATHLGSFSRPLRMSFLSLQVTNLLPPPTTPPYHFLFLNGSTQLIYSVC